MYVPPASEISMHEKLSVIFKRFLELYRRKSDDIFIICGGFNCPFVNWVRDIDNEGILFPTNSPSAIIDKMFNFLLSNELNQINSITNFQNRILDLVFSSDNDKMCLYECPYPLLPIDVFHKPIEISISLTWQKAIKYSCRKSFNFMKADFNNINNFLASIDWNQMLVTCNNSVDEYVDFFYDKILFAVELFVPFSNLKSNTHPPWYNKKILSLKNRKSKAYKK